MPDTEEQTSYYSPLIHDVMENAPAVHVVAEVTTQKLTVRKRHDVAYGEMTMIFKRYGSGYSSKLVSAQP